MTMRRMLLTVSMRISFHGDYREREDESMATGKIHLCSLRKMSRSGHLSGISDVGSMLYPLQWMPGLKVITTYGG